MNNKNLLKHSKFSEFCFKNYIEVGKVLFDIGCGNGRDTKYFIKRGLNVVGVDKKTDYWEIDFRDLIKIKFKNIDYVYIRFVLHAIDNKLAQQLLKWCYSILKSKGKIFIEARSVNDELYGRGILAGRDSFVYHHYRRFIRKKELIKYLKKIKFKIIFEDENIGFSPLKNEDPCLIRIVAEK